jgi:hypothetical protein
MVVNMEGDEEAGLYIGISINDSIELVKDDSSFLKVSQLTSKINDIDMTRRHYVLEAAILDGPYLDDTVSDKNTYWATVGDETGLIHLVDYNDRFLSKLHKEDTIKIIGALSLTDGIQLSYYGVIEKIGVLGYDSLEKLRRGTRIFPPNKVVTIGEEQSKGGVKVILHRMHLLEENTRLFLTIENMNEKEVVRVSQLYLRLFQGKKQFEYTFSRDPHFRMVKELIPPGIEEIGVMLFEALSNTEDPVKVHLQVTIQGRGTAVFVFDALNISK